ncbi:sulfotransferase domain-containing protein [Rhizomicrobium electricum]|uniref:Sulfotransferase domain-containing protein n=1 Tax=Rhizomicrobium electricum TaxID=480070 RepID=A0ABN1EFD2_9PROT|nr:hypothetical protein [Rhizomicrobium electricum]
MTRTVWLASYPKSGNTWVRMLAANCLAQDGRPVGINDLSERSGIASARAPFDFLLLIDSGLLTHDEADRLRPRVYEQLARGAEDDTYDVPQERPPVRLVKVHDAYTQTAQGEPLLAGNRGADGVIVIVRDPRDVAPSLAHHNGTGVDQAIAFMGNPEACFCAKTRALTDQFRQRLLTWSGHVASWLDQADLPVHLLRYEDLQADAAGTIAKALDFAGCPVADERIGGAVERTRFAELQRQELDAGFREAPRTPTQGRFFRRGVAGGWRSELTAEQIARIEREHAPMMSRLGYALSGEMPTARRKALS